MIKDLTPTQRALLRALELALLAALFQGVLVILSLLGTGITLNQVFISALGQAALVLMGTLSKYLKASGQPLLSTLANQAAQEVTPRVAPVKLSTNEQAMSATFNAYLDSVSAQPAQVSPLSIPVVQAAPVAQPVAQPKPAQPTTSDVVSMNTLPSIPTVQ